jgi:hypothetical protein
VTYCLSDYQATQAQLEVELKAVRSWRFVSPEQFFIVYLNNLTNRQFKNLTEQLSNDRPPFYIGFADLTRATWLKTWISLVIGQRFLVFDNHILLAAEEDDYGRQLQSLALSI